LRAGAGSGAAAPGFSAAASVSALVRSSTSFFVSAARSATVEARVGGGGTVDKFG
jgi:hypothetical protein